MIIVFFKVQCLINNQREISLSITSFRRIIQKETESPFLIGTHCFLVRILIHGLNLSPRVDLSEWTTKIKDQASMGSYAVNAVLSSTTHVATDYIGIYRQLQQQQR